MPPRCIKCLTALTPGTSSCPNCGRPAPPKSAFTQQKEIDTTQFIRLAPGELLSEEPPPAPTGASHRPLLLAVVLGLLAGALLLFVLVSFTHTWH